MIRDLELFFLSYFAVVNGTYVALLFLGVFRMYRRFRQVEEEDTTSLLQMEAVVELFAWIYVGVAFYNIFLQVEFFWTLLALSFGFTTIYSMVCLLIEEMTFRKYPSMKSLLVLFLCNWIENIGYRQMTVYWRIRGFFSFFRHWRGTNRESREIRKKLSREKRAS